MSKSLVNMVLFVGGFLIGVQSGVHAEQAGSAHVSSLEEIVVTATKTGETDIQETSLSITAFSADGMSRSGVENIEDLAVLTPGLSISNNGGRARLYIRGIGTNLDFAGSDPSVTVHMDGVYLGRSGAIFADFIDLERVEVLRGPQGTLYGRNSAGGAINLVSKVPTDEPEGKIDLSYGSYKRSRAAVSYHGPITDDTLFFSLSGLYSTRDGFVDNIAVNGDDLSDEETFATRLALRATPTDNLEIHLSADYMDQGGSGPTYKQTGLLFDGSPAPSPFGVAGVPDGMHKVNIPAKQLPFGAPDPSVDREFQGFSARVDYNINENLSLTSITGYREMEVISRADTDYSEVDEIVSYIDESQDQTSQEIQFNLNLNNLNLIFGLFYFNEDTRIFGDIILPGPGIATFGTPEFNSDLITQVETDAWAGYAQGNYDISEKLALTMGVRYNYEEKAYQTYNFLLVGGAEIPLFTSDQKESWNSITPKFGIDYHLNEDVLVYFNVTRGFKSGGYNFTSPQGAFDEEFLWAYESGVKSDWFDNRLRINASAFYYDYEDLQVQQFVSSDGGAAQVEISNAASAEVYGLELELTAKPTPELDISIGLAYLDTEYDNYITQRTGVPVDIDVSGNRLSNSPEWSFNFAGQYTADIADYGKASIRLEYQWIDDQFYTQFNDPITAQESFDLVNMRVFFTPTDDQWEASLFGENLADEEYTNSIQDFSATGVTLRIMPPRTWGLRFRYFF